MYRNISWKILALLLALLAFLPAAGCTQRDVQAVKQIENYLKEQEKLDKTLINLDIDKLDAQNAMNIIKELSSEKYKGRKTGTKENELAVKYISDYFSSIGLEKPKELGSYLQVYYQPVTLLNRAPELVLYDEYGQVIKNYKYPKNFALRVLSDSTNDIQLYSPVQVVNSFKELSDVQYKDKPILLFSKKMQGRNSPTEIMKTAYACNASAVMLEVDVNGDDKKSSDLVVTPLNNRFWGEKYIPVVTIDSSTFSDLTAAAEKKQSIYLGCSYTTEDSHKAYNIVGYIPGSDEKLRNSYIIIGGHMDHVGDNLNGTYNPGAFDNASGTSAMMEVARMIAQNPVKPKKSIVFIAFNGEEYGLMGSEYYVENPEFPLEDTVMINLDMVGSSYKLPLSIASGLNNAADLRYEMFGMAKTLGIDAAAITMDSSDHVSFGSKNVLSVMLSHADLMHGYHSPNDNMEDVDVDRMKEVLKLVLYYIDRKAY